VGAMKKKMMCFIVVCLLAGNVFAGEKELKEKIKNLQEAERKGQKIEVDNLLRGELNDFLSKNPNVPLKNFRKFRLAVKASGFVIRDLNKKYGATDNNYQEKITDKKDRYVYQTALRTLERDEYKVFYLCKGEDKKKVKESWEKVDTIRTQISEKLQNEPGFRDSDEYIRLEEQILKECRFKNAEFSLLHVYRVRGEKDEKYRKKFNELLLRMIADDQINYDYLYVGLESINSGFVIDYLWFFTNVNSLGDKLILTKEQVEFIANAILDKHREVFNIRNYYPGTEEFNEYRVRDVIQSMVNLSTWLRFYNLDDLNEKIIKRFLDDEFVMRTMKEDIPRFKDYRDYLLKRMDFQKYEEME